MDLLTKAPIDLYSLALLQLVAKHRSFTKAATAAGLTQSAVTRQIQSVEQSLGIPLFIRTTRKVIPTGAGEFLIRESARLVGDIENTLKRMREEFANVPKEIRVVVSRSISLAYLPGFFHKNIKSLDNVSYRVRYSSCPEVLMSLECAEEDIGVICLPARIPPTLEVTHRFRDVFTCIASAEAIASKESSFGAKTEEWLMQQRWLLFTEETTTGRLLRQWLTKQRMPFQAAMELDNFDLIVNLVSLGMGASFVPSRTLALYPNKRGIKRVPLPAVFSRELAVVTRKRANTPAHLRAFVDYVLF